MKLLSLITLSIALISCTNDIAGGRTIVISVASDYSECSAAGILPNTLNDQAAFIETIRSLSDKAEIHMFRCENMRSYYSTNPVFANELKDATVYFMKEDGTLGRRYTKKLEFKPYEGTTAEKDWSMWDVSEFLASIKTTKNDLLIFHYSGHGDIDGNLAAGMHSDKLVLVNKDEIFYFLSDDYRSGIKLAILDSCYSGSFVQNNSLHSGYVFHDSRLAGTSMFESFKKSFKRGEKIAQTYIFAAARSNQSSYDNYNFGAEEQRYFGFFSYHFLKAMGFDFSSFSITRRKPISIYGIYQELMRNMEKDMLVKATPEITLSKKDVILFS